MKSRKRLLFILILGFIALTGLTFIIQPTFKEFILNQLAAVVGINIESVYDYQTNKGLKGDLAIGDRGKDVMLVQQALRKLRPDFPEANVTGYYGKKTASAISLYQEEQGLPVTGKVDLQTRTHLNEVYFQELCPEADLNAAPEDILTKVNREISLPENYIPKDLTKLTLPIKTTRIICLKKDVIPYLSDMVQAAEDDNILLAVTSGFRRPEIQGVIYKILVHLAGDKAKEGIAEPAHSEHQLGTTVDLAGATNNYEGADDYFDRTPEDKWLKENAYKFGFVMSYPKDKVSVTGYKYEPWHYRFVGIEAAKDIFNRKISVEEYLN